MLPITATNEIEKTLCPVRNVLANVSGKWQTLILLSLEDGPLRFSAIKRTVGDITQRVLTENLRMLERDGYLTRTVKPGPPIEVSYELTKLGFSLVEKIKPVVIWASNNYDKIVKSRKLYDNRDKN